MFTLTTPKAVRNPDTTARDLSELLGVDPSKLRARLERTPGVITKTSSLNQAERIQQAFKAVGVKVEIQEGDQSSPPPPDSQPPARASGDPESPAFVSVIHQPVRVTVADFDMPFWSIVKMMIKWTVASLPAVLFLSFIAGILMFSLSTCAGAL